MTDGLQALRTFLDEIARRRAALAWRPRVHRGRGGWPARCCSSPAMTVRLLGPATCCCSLATVAAGVERGARPSLAVALWSTRGRPTPAADCAAGRRAARRPRRRRGHGGRLRRPPRPHPAMADRLGHVGRPRGVDRSAPDVVVDGGALPAAAARRAGRGAGAAGGASAVFVRPLGDAASVASAYLMPSRIAHQRRAGERARARRAVLDRARPGARRRWRAPALVAGERTPMRCRSR